MLVKYVTSKEGKVIQTNRQYSDILILGAGYGGLQVAQKLRNELPGDDAASVTLINRHSFHSLLIELPVVAGGDIPQQDVEISLDRLIEGGRIEFVQASVIGFDFTNNTVQTDKGDFGYGKLVIALGSETNFYKISGRENALTCITTTDAARIRATVETNFAAAKTETDPDLRRRLLTFAVGGAGATGVELAGELAEFTQALAKQHMPDVTPHVILFEGTPAVLPGFPADLVKKATDILRDLHVDLRPSHKVAAIEPNTVVIDSGERISVGMFVWTGGVKPVAILGESGLTLGVGGRVVVDEYLRLVDHPDVYVIGDNALIFDPETERPVPPTAQSAVVQGRQVAENLLAERKGRQSKPFKLVNFGTLVSVGSAKAVGTVFGRNMAGRSVHLLKDLLDWEYRQAVSLLGGRGVL